MIEEAQAYIENIVGYLNDWQGWQVWLNKNGESTACQRELGGDYFIRADFFLTTHDYKVSLLHENVVVVARIISAPKNTRSLDVAHAIDMATWALEAMVNDLKGGSSE